MYKTPPLLSHHPEDLPSEPLPHHRFLGRSAGTLRAANALDIGRDGAGDDEHSLRDCELNLGH
jgi:hypothetical protein